MDTVDELIKEGINAHRKGDLAEATRLYEAALTLDATSANAHNNLGFVLGQQQQWADALAHLHTALDIDPQLAMAHSNLGQVLVATGNTLEGLEHLEQAVLCDPENATAWDNLARMRLLAGFPERAETAARRALKLLPHDPHLLTRLGTTLAAQKRFREALPCFQHAISLDGNHSEAWVQLGINQFQCGDLISGREALEIAIALDPHDLNALRHLALVNLNTGNHNGAIAHFERLLGLQPDDDSSRIELAVIFLANQQTDAALAHLELVQGPARASSQYQYYHGMSLLLDGKRQQGYPILHRLSQQQDDEYSAKARRFLQTL